MIGQNDARLGLDCVSSGVRKFGTSGRSKGANINVSAHVKYGFNFNNLDLGDSLYATGSGGGEGVCMHNRLNIGLFAVNITVHREFNRWFAGRARLYVSIQIKLV